MKIILFPFILLMSIIGFSIGLYGAIVHSATPEEGYVAAYEFSRKIKKELGDVVYIFALLLWMVILSLLYRLLI